MMVWNHAPQRAVAARGACNLHRLADSKAAFSREFWGRDLVEVCEVPCPCRLYVTLEEVLPVTETFFILLVAYTAVWLAATKPWR